MSPCYGIFTGAFARRPMSRRVPFTVTGTTPSVTPSLHEESVTSGVSPGL